MPGNLIILGTGIKSLAHLTMESKKIISGSDKVLYLLNEPLMKEWIQKTSKNSESLDDIYFSSRKRFLSYKRIANYIYEEFLKYNSLCVVLYGHPTFFASPALWAADRVSKEGGKVSILPSISSLDCLFADMKIDPGEDGYFACDATDFLIYKRRFDVTSHVFLLQVGSLGCHNLEKSKKIGVLSSYLGKFYPNNYKMFVYEASQRPGNSPKIIEVKLSSLASISLGSLSTLYIPPLSDPILAKEMVDALEMNIEDFI